MASTGADQQVRIKVGDRIRVVGEFTVESIEETPFGVQYTHVDRKGQHWGFIPGPSTTSITVIEEEA